MKKKSIEYHNHSVIARLEISYLVKRHKNPLKLFHIPLLRQAKPTLPPFCTNTTTAKFPFSPQISSLHPYIRNQLIRRLWSWSQRNDGINIVFFGSREYKCVKFSSNFFLVHVNQYKHAIRFFMFSNVIGKLIFYCTSLQITFRFIGLLLT